MKKNVSATLVGLWSSWMLTLHLNYGLKQAFGININLAFTELASIYDNSIIFISNFICFAFGVFIACYVKKERYWIAGISTLCCNIFLVMALLIVCIIFGVVPAWLYGLLLVEFIAGMSGILTYKYLRKYFADNFNHEAYKYIDYYFAPKGRTFFTIILFFTAVYALVINIPAIILFFKWLFIAPFYVLLHPGLWVGALFRDTGEFIISPLLLVIAPLFFIHWVYEIGISSKTKLKKTIFLLLLFIAFNFVNAISISMVRGPIERSVTHFASKGEKIWDILLDRYTRPLEREIRYKYLIEKGKSYEAQKILDEAINGYFKLAYESLKGENLKLAEDSASKILELSGNDEHLENIGLLYFDFEIYYKSAEIFEKLYKKDPQNVNYLEYLQDCYYELDMEEKILPLAKKEYKIRKNELTEEEKREFLNYIADLEDKLKINEQAMKNKDI